MKSLDGVGIDYLIQVYCDGNNIEYFSPFVGLAVSFFCG
jgi:hypothetical protein